MPFDCTCLQCGKPFPRHPRFCSSACKYIAASPRQRLSPSALLARKTVKTGRKATDCWRWDGYTGQKGYGYVRVGGRAGVLKLAHRLAWELQYGPIPEGLWVLHRCDVPRCVRPGHLFLGTPADNNWDMSRKGRHYSRTRPDLVPRGERTGKAKLTAAHVVAIRSHAALGKLHREIAAWYGVTRTTISSVVARKSWAHVE